MFYTAFLFLVSTGMRNGQSHKKHHDVVQVPNDELPFFLEEFPELLKFELYTDDLLGFACLVGGKNVQIFSQMLV